MVAGPAQDWPMIRIIGPNLEKTDLSNYPGSSNQTEHHHHTCVLLPPCHYFYIKLDLNPPPQIGLLLIWLVSNVIGRSDWAMSFFSTFLLLRVSIYFPNPDNVRNHLDKVQNIQRQWTKTQSRYLHSLLSILSLTEQGRVTRVMADLSCAIKIPTQPGTITGSVAQTQRWNSTCCRGGDLFYLNTHHWSLWVFLILEYRDNSIFQSSLSDISNIPESRVTRDWRSI